METTYFNAEIENSVITHSDIERLFEKAADPKNSLEVETLLFTIEKMTVGNLITALMSFMIPADKKAWLVIKDMTGTLRTKADVLNNGGYLTPKGYKFTPTQVKRLITKFSK